MNSIEAPQLRIVSGQPDADELAALIAGLSGLMTASGRPHELAALGEFSGPSGPDSSGGLSTLEDPAAASTPANQPATQWQRRARARGRDVIGYAERADSWRWRER